MKLKYIFVALFALAQASAASASANNETEVYRKALNLYQNRLYEGAKNLFETVPQEADSEGYAVLCALKMRSADAPSLLASYRKKHPTSNLINDILFENARIQFDAEDYSAAAAELGQVKAYNLSDEAQQEYWFKRGFSEYSIKHDEEAIKSFEHLEQLPLCDYTSCAYYLHGTILYNQRNFKEAVKRFKVSAKDSRFSDMSRFYLVDSEFNMKNYDYAIAEGEAIYAKAPKERRERLARIISGSYLVKGDKEKAREYYESSSHSDLTRSDIFYAGSVLYAVEDYEGAIAQFTQMKNRTDSLGQIANYQLANSYLRTNKMSAAMRAFKDASKATFDKTITEDALFNYAKLSFDLNKDTAGFSEYIRKYPNSKGEMIYSYMALAKLVDKDYAGAVEAYDNIDELGDDMRANYTKANFLRADQLMKKGEYQEALPFLRTCNFYLDKNDRFGQLARYCMADSYYRTENYKEAAHAYLDLYNADAFFDRPEGKMLPYNIGYSYLRQENYNSAAKWFETYINSGDTTWISDARFRLATCDRKSAAAKDTLAALGDKSFVALAVPDSLTKFDYKFDYSVFESPYRGAYEFSPYYVKTNPSKSVYDGRKLYLRAGAGYSLHPQLEVYYTPLLTENKSFSVYNSGRGYFGNYTMGYGHSVGEKFKGYDFADRLGFQADWIKRKSCITINGGWDGIFSKSLDCTSSFNSAFADVNFRSREYNPSFFYYDVDLAYRYGKDNLGALGSYAENYFSVKASIGPVIKKKFRILVDLGVDYNAVREKEYNGGIQVGQFVVDATPHLLLNLGPLSLDAGVRFNFGADGLHEDSGSPFQIAPAVTASLAILKDQVNLYAGFVGGQKLHTYSNLKQLCHFNHYTYDMPGITRTKYNAFAGFKGDIGQHFNYDLSGGYEVADNAVVQAFGVLERCNVKRLYVDFSAGWTSDNLTVDGNVRFGRMTVPEDDFAILDPAFKFDVRGVYNWNKRIYAGVWIECSGKRQCSRYFEDIPAYVSPGLYGEYRLASGLGVFLEAGNLLGMQIQRTPGYIEKGPYATVGITLNL